jgi:endonuclease/exonuclease/phosphatase family metal-dependent hydrolase
MVWKLDVGGGKFVHVIGIHLKCCGGAANDIRRNNTMKNLIAWIDVNTNAADGVMLMGDFNAVSPVDTVPSFLGYQSGFEPASGSSLNDGPLRMLLDPSDPDASGVHTFQDAFRTANPTCGSDPDCCADTLCDATGLPSGGCPERGYTYVGDTHNFDSRIDFIMINQNVLVTGAATAGDVGGTSVCTASDHIAVDAIVSF